MEDKGSTGGVATATMVSSVASVKKTTKIKSKNQRLKSSHPPTSEMVNAAIKELKDRKGSSLQAIKKYITATYKVDGEKTAPFIKRYLKAAVTAGSVLQTKGKGASGSFKLSMGKTAETKAKLRRIPHKLPVKKTQSVQKKTAVTRKPATAKKPTAVKKAARGKKSVKKATITKPTASSIRVKVRTDAKTMSKSKKTAKAPAAKTKTPKPKKVAAKKTAKK